MSCCSECLKSIIRKFTGTSQKMEPYRPTNDFVEEEATEITMTMPVKEQQTVVLDTSSSAAKSKPKPKKQTPAPKKTTVVMSSFSESGSFGEQTDSNSDSPELITSEPTYNDQRNQSNINKESSSTMASNLKVQQSQKVVDLLDLNPLEDQQLEYKKSKKKPLATPEQNQVQLILPVVETTSFKINLDPSDKYYAVLVEKTKELDQKLNLPNSTPIVLQQRIAPADLEIRHLQQNNINIFAYSFRLNCSYSFYNSMLNDYQLQKKLDPNIDDFKMLELHTNNVRINYLSYKKILIISPRDFVYLRYTNSWNNDYWEVSFSVPSQDMTGKIRGDIVLNASKIVEEDGWIKVNVYSEVDMKLTTNPKMTRVQAVNEIRKYVEKCQEYVKNNYRTELV